MIKLRFATLLVATFAMIAFLPISANAQDIEAGIDVWQTRGDGSTFATFQDEPLPADFFCSGSAPFTGKIAFKGKPIVTEPAGIFRTADTILERLDHASFDENGVAVTRLQMRAMQFEGIELLQTECGAFKVELVLHGEQPITEMRIYHPKTLALRGAQAAPNGAGRFAAEIGVNTLIRFTSVDHGGPALEVPRNALFPPLANSYWSERPGQRGIAFRSFVKVDTNSDGLADTFLPGTSRNFAAGWAGEQTQTEIVRAVQMDYAAPAGGRLGVNRVQTLKQIDEFDDNGCHDDGCGGTHCPTPIVIDDGAAATQ